MKTKRQLQTFPQKARLCGGNEAKLDTLFYDTSGNFILFDFQLSSYGWTGDGISEL